jgi:hypothetical protein
MIRTVPQLPRVNEIEQAIMLLNRAAIRMKPFGRLTFQLNWEPLEERIKVVKRRRKGKGAEPK